MTYHAGVFIRLPGSLSLTEREDLIERARELAHPIPGSSPFDLLITWEADDLWQLRGLVEQTVDELSSWTYGNPDNLFPDRDEAYANHEHGDAPASYDLSKFAWWQE